MEVPGFSLSHPSRPPPLHFPINYNLGDQDGDDDVVASEFDSAAVVVQDWGFF